MFGYYICLTIPHAKMFTQLSVPTEFFSSTAVTELVCEVHQPS